MTQSDDPSLSENNELAIKIADQATKICDGNVNKMLLALSLTIAMLGKASGCDQKTIRKLISGFWDIGRAEIHLVNDDVVPKAYAVVKKNDET